MIDVFVSYAQTERTLMMPLKLRLEALGLILFVDVDGRLDGEPTFPDALNKGVRTSKAVLGCWSPWALTRPWVQTECAIGKDENKLVAVERAPLDATDVPALFYLVDRKKLTDFDGVAPHEGWASTLSALATKLKLWLDKRPDDPEAADVREKIAVLEKAAADELVALATSRRGSPAPVTAERAWAAIDQSLEVSHYRRFERTFEADPTAFKRVIEAEARAKALERWSATDQTDVQAIAEISHTGMFPALQAVADRALAAAQLTPEWAEGTEAVRRVPAKTVPEVQFDPGKSLPLSVTRPLEKNSHVVGHHQSLVKWWTWAPIAVNFVAILTVVLAIFHSRETGSSLFGADEPSSRRKTEEKRAADETEAEQKRLADEAARRAEQKRLADEAARKAEQQRLADEAARKAEQQRLADEAARKAEQKRLADEAARRAEQQRLADEAARRAEQKRLADEAARRAEQKRLAAEASRRAEQKRRAADNDRIQNPTIDGERLVRARRAD